MNRHSSIRRLLLPEASAAMVSRGFVTLDKDKLKHLRKVLRMEWNDHVLITDGTGSLYEGQLEKLGDSGGVSLGKCMKSTSAPAPLELVLCLAKNSTMDWVVEKAVECGVTHIVPVVSARSVVRVDENESGKYLRRWQSIMDEAVEQSERLWRPIVEAPVSWRKALDELPQMSSFVFSSELRSEGIVEKEALKECWNSIGRVGSKPLRLAIGPEGGFSSQERDELKQAGYIELSLGEAVLRVETAVITALTVARFARQILP